MDPQREQSRRALASSSGSSSSSSSSSAHAGHRCDAAAFPGSAWKARGQQRIKRAWLCCRQAASTTLGCLARPSTGPSLQSGHLHHPGVDKAADNVMQLACSHKTTAHYFSCTLSSCTEAATLRPPVRWTLTSHQACTSTAADQCRHSPCGLPTSLQLLQWVAFIVPRVAKLGTAFPQAHVAALMFTIPSSLHLAQCVGLLCPGCAKLGCARLQKHLRGAAPTFVMPSSLHLQGLGWLSLELLEMMDKAGPAPFKPAGLHLQGGAIPVCLHLVGGAGWPCIDPAVCFACAGRCNCCEPGCRGT